MSPLCIELVQASPASNGQPLLVWLRLSVGTGMSLKHSPRHNHRELVSRVK